MMNPGYSADEQFLRQCALEALRGVGNAALGEWEEWNGSAYHIKRRLSRDEQKLVGPPVDIRSTDEQERRYNAVKSFLPENMKEWRE